MENKVLVNSVNIKQLNYKIYMEMLENDLLDGEKNNLYDVDKTITEIAILTLYQIAVLNQDYEKIKFNLTDLDGIKEFKQSIYNDL